MRNLFFHILSNALKLGEKNDYCERHILREKSMQSNFFDAHSLKGEESSITSSEVTSYNVALLRQKILVVINNKAFN